MDRDSFYFARYFISFFELLNFFPLNVPREYFLPFPLIASQFSTLNFLLSSFIVLFIDFFWLLLLLLFDYFADIFLWLFAQLSFNRKRFSADTKHLEQRGSASSDAIMLRNCFLFNLNLFSVHFNPWAEKKNDFSTLATTAEHSSPDDFSLHTKGELFFSTFHSKK